MAKIPLADLPGSAKVIDHSARYQGVSSDFGMEKSRAILRAADIVTRGSEQLGKSIMEYNAKMQQAEDDFATAEAMADWKQRQQNLIERMKSNPNSAEEFGKWAQEVDDQWQKDVAQYTDRMSNRSKKMFEIQMSVDRNASIKERSAISNMARVQRLYDGTINLATTQLHNNDEIGARETLKKAYENGVISQKDYDKYDQFLIPQQMQLNKIRAIETNNNIADIDNAISNLDKAGSEEFKNLSPEQRRTFSQRLHARKNQLQNENYTSRLVDIVNGNDKYTIAQYKEMFENGGIDERAYISLVEGKQARNYVGMIDNLALTSEADFPKVKETYLNIIETEKADNNLSEHQYNEVKKALNHKEYTVAKNAFERLKAQQTAANKQQQDMQNMFLGAVRSKIQPLNPFENMQQKQIVIDNMKNIFKDPNVQLHMVTEIEKIFSEGLEGKGIFDTPQGKAFKNWFDIQYRTEEGKGAFDVSKLEYDPAGRGDWDSEDFVAYRGYELLQYGAELLKTGMPENKVKELVQERFNQMTEQRAKEIMHKIELQNSYINKNTVKGK